MKCYEVLLFVEEKGFYYSYMEFAESSKHAKDKAKIKTNNKIISARVIN